MGHAGFAEIGKRVSGGGSVTSPRERKGSFIARHRLGWGSLQIQYLGSLALGITLRHPVLQATSAPALPEACSFGTVAPCPSRTQEASPGRPPPPWCSAPWLQLGKYCGVSGPPSLRGPRAVGSSCHTSQQAGCGHWAPPGPVQARSSP